LRVEGEGWRVEGGGASPNPQLLRQLQLSLRGGPGLKEKEPERESAGGGKKQRATERKFRGLRHSDRKKELRVGRKSDEERGLRVEGERQREE
jgi:hypothetical protein